MLGPIPGLEVGRGGSQRFSCATSPWPIHFTHQTYKALATSKCWVETPVVTLRGRIPRGRLLNTVTLHHAQMAKRTEPVGAGGKAHRRATRRSKDQSIKLSEPRVIAMSAEERQAAIDALADLLAAWWAGQRAEKPREES